MVHGSNDRCPTFFGAATAPLKHIRCMLLQMAIVTDQKMLTLVIIFLVAAAKTIVFAIL